MIRDSFGWRFGRFISLLFCKYLPCGTLSCFSHLIICPSLSSLVQFSLFSHLICPKCSHFDTLFQNALFSLSSFFNLLYFFTIPHLSQLHTLNNSQLTHKTHRWSALAAQNEISWKHIFMGRLSKEWGRAQYIYMKNSNVVVMKNTLQKRRMEKEVSRLSLSHTVWTWSLGSKKLHGDTPQNEWFKRRQKAIQKAKVLFQEGEETVPEKQRRLFLNYEWQIEGRTHVIEHWIDLVEFAQKKLQELKDKAERKAKQPTMKDFFPPQETNTSRSRWEIRLKSASSFFIESLNGMTSDMIISRVTRVPFLNSGHWEKYWVPFSSWGYHLNSCKADFCLWFQYHCRNTHKS